MVNISQLQRDIKVVRRALGRNKDGYDENGYDEEGKDRYGRSRQSMESEAKLQEMAFNSLSKDNQEFVMKAEEIMRRLTEKAIDWEIQPFQVRKKASFYEEYMSRSEITRHAFLIGLWLTEDEQKLVDEAFHILLEAEKKINPYHQRHGRK